MPVIDPNYKLVDLSTTASSNLNAIFYTASAVGNYKFSDIIEMIDIEKLWEKMYIKTMGVIVACSYCNTPQAIGNSNCSQCGSPLPKPKPLGEGI